MEELNWSSGSLLGPPHLLSTSYGGTELTTEAMEAIFGPLSTSYGGTELIIGGQDGVCEIAFYLLWRN